MNHTLRVRVLHGIGGVGDKRDARAEVEARFVSEARDRHALDKLHDEVRATSGGHAAIHDACDPSVLHAREGAPLGIKARKHRMRIHAGLDHLDRDGLPKGLGAFGLPDHAKSPRADLLKKPERSDRVAGAFHRLSAGSDALRETPRITGVARVLKKERVVRARNQKFHEPVSVRSSDGPFVAAGRRSAASRA